MNPWIEAVKSMKNLNRYDVIIMDTHPSSGMATSYPLQSCDEVLVPLEPNERSVSGFTEVCRAIMKARRVMNPDIHLLGYFFNKVKNNTSSAKEYIPSVRAEIPKVLTSFGEGIKESICFQTTIRDSEDAQKAINFHCAVTDKFRRGKLSKDFEKLYVEIKEALNHD